MGKNALPAVVAAGLLLTLSGCAAVGLTALGVAGGTGTSYTLDSIAYRTFTTPVDDLRRATLMTLRRMDITLTSDDATKEGGRAIVATAADRTIYIDLERLTTRTTRMRITAKQGWFLRDRATAGEIIAQTERTLDDLPVLTQKTR